MNNFFLYNEAIDLEDFEAFKDGMSELNALVEIRNNNDQFLKHDSVWNLENTLKVMSHQDFQSKAILLFIQRSCTSIENYIANTATFDNNYPNELNGFLGIDFSNTGIIRERQITNQESFLRFFSQFNCNGNINQITTILEVLFSNYTFEKRAIEDITYWNQENFESYQKLILLLQDIPQNPFTGGLGMTEALKHEKGTASKRINRGNRITYNLKGNSITVLACRGHYD